MIELPVIAIAPLKKINHVACVVKGSYQLHFIWINDPFSVHIHPLQFSDKPICRMFYFERSSVMISIGHGILITKVIIPLYFKGGNPISETLQFEKIIELYPETKFCETNMPEIVESKEIIIVPNNSSIYIYNSQGALVQAFNPLCESIITSISFFSEAMKLVVGTESGVINILSFSQERPFIAGAKQEKASSVQKYSVSSLRITAAFLFDRHFMISVDADQQMLVMCLKNGEKISKTKAPLTVTHASIVDNLLILFSALTIDIFKCLIFTKHFENISCNATMLRRAPSLSHAARILVLGRDATLSLVSPKDGKMMIGLKSANLAKDIQFVSYARDVQIDGSRYFHTAATDTLFLSLDQGIILGLALNKINNKLRPQQSEQILSTVPNFKASWIPTTTIQSMPNMRFVSFFKLDSKSYQQCVCGVTQYGQVLIFSLQLKRLVTTLSPGIADVICAIYSFANHMIIFSCVGKLVAYDINALTIYGTVEKCMYTSLEMFDEDTLICGGANGVLEIRNIPFGFKLIASSIKYDAYHSDNGRRFPLDDSYPDSKQLYEIPFAIKSLDYLQTREVVLSVSVVGEMFLWDKNAYPIIHITLPFIVTSACFLNGNGSILLSAFNNLFVIDFSFIFQKPHLAITSPLDEYDLRPDNILLAENDELTPASMEYQEDIFMREIDQISSSDDEPFESNFDPLVVEEEFIPKRHVAPPREFDEFKKVIAFQHEDVDEILQKEQIEEEKKKSLKPKRKNIVVRSRRSKSQRKRFDHISKTKKHDYDDDDYEYGKSKKNTFKMSKPKANNFDKFIKASYSINKMNEDEIFNHFNKPIKLRKIDLKQGPHTHNPRFSKGYQHNTDDDEYDKVSTVSGVSQGINLGEGKTLVQRSQVAFKITPMIKDSTLMKSVGSFGQVGVPSFEKLKPSPSSPEFKLKRHDQIKPKHGPPSHPMQRSQSVRDSGEEKSVRGSTAGKSIENDETFFPTEQKSVMVATAPIQLKVQEPPPSSRSRRTLPSPRAVKEEIKLNPDSDLFTKYHIDGFKQPFGGFIISGKSKDGVLEKSSKAPIMRIHNVREKSPIIEKKAKTLNITYSKFVYPHTLEREYDLNNMNVRVSKL